MKKIFFITLTLVFFYITPFSFAAVLEFPFNTSNKSFFYLNKTILHQEGVSIFPENEKFSSLSQTYTLIDFESYLPSFNSITLVNDAKIGKTSGLFFNKDSHIIVPFDQSLENGIVIEFWAKPLSTLKSTIFLTQFLSEEGITKEISVALEKGRLKVNFQNMFISDSVGKMQTVSLSSNIKILPNIWAHHRIVYTPNDGKLTYYNDNQLDNETWATKSRLPRSSILFLDEPQHPRMILGSNYRGLIDQFMISNNPFRDISNQIIGYDEGSIYTRVISLPERAVINLIQLESIKPKDTDYIIEYRIAELPFDDNTPTEIVPWQEYNSLHPDKNPLIKGKYIQTRIRLFSDPNNTYSPLIKKLMIYYSSFEMPLKPIDLKAYSSSGNLTISLHQSTNNTISAYKVYIGTKPDSFFGDPENGIQSPILIPVSNLSIDAETKHLSYNISGLTPNKLYYIKVTALSINNVESDFSDTITTRIRTLE